jgi:hypothetical protein
MVGYQPQAIIAARVNTYTAAFMLISKAECDE